MPDFGDEVGDFVWRQLFEEGRRLFSLAQNQVSGIIANRRAEAASSAKLEAERRTQDLLQATLDEQSRTNELFRDAMINGSNGAYDFTDGIAQDYTFDLSWLGNDPDIQQRARLVLDDVLRSQGLDPSNVTEVLEDRWVKAGGVSQLMSSPTGEYNLSFSDNPAEVAKVASVIESYQRAVYLDPIIQEHIAKTHGLEAFHLEAVGFGLLDDTKRADFVSGLRTSLSEQGFNGAELVDVSRNEDGFLSGDLTLALDANNRGPEGVFDAFVARWNKEHPDSSIKAELSLVAASKLDASFDERISFLDEFASELRSEGLDVACYITRDGSFVIDPMQSSPEAVRDVLERHTLNIRQVSDKATSLERAQRVFGEKAVQATKSEELIEHAKEASDFIKEHGVGIVMQPPSLSSPEVAVPALGR